MRTRPVLPSPLSNYEHSLLKRWPILATQPRGEWDRAAIHLEAAETAHNNGQDCPICPPPRRTKLRFAAARAKATKRKMFAVARKHKGTP